MISLPIVKLPNKAWPSPLHSWDASYKQQQQQQQQQHVGQQYLISIALSNIHFY